MRKELSEHLFTRNNRNIVGLSLIFFCPVGLALLGKNSLASILSKDFKSFNNYTPYSVSVVDRVVQMIGSIFPRIVDIVLICFFLCTCGFDVSKFSEWFKVE